MRALKVTFALAGMLAITQYVPAYYNSSQFSYFVVREAARAKSAAQLKESVLEQARAYSLPVKESDIRINNIDAVLRVSVDYKVPLNLLVYNPELQFHVAGAGLLPVAR
jgi:hypothetical protein